jgi:hypothetical protein
MDSKWRFVFVLQNGVAQKFSHISRTWVQCVKIRRFTPHGSVMHIAVILWKQTSEVAIVFVLDFKLSGQRHVFEE